jgi:ABC-type multidrug transport system permease subunit
VVEVLRGLADSGRTVVSTIHQPNSETFENFDQLCLMAQGHIIYHNSANKAVNYFTKIGYKCPDGTNPADFFMNMMSIEAYEDVDNDDADELARSKTMIEESYKAKIIDMYEKYEQSELRSDPDDMHPEVEPIKATTDKKTGANFCFQFWLLLMRSLRNIIRLPVASYVKVMSTIIVCLMIILVFGTLDHDTDSIQTRNGVLFFISIVLIMNSVTNVTLIFPDERPVFLREQGAEMYNPIAYFFAKFFSELPLMIINTVLFFVLIYFSIGLNTESAKQPFIFYFYILLLVWTGTGLGFAMGTLVAEKSVAVGLTPVTVIPLMLLSGYFVNQDNIVPVLTPFEYISPFKYALQVLVINEYDDLPLDCHPN